MMRKSVVILACLAMLAVLGACAKKKSVASVNDVFAKYDTDKNGVITKEEFTSAVKDKQKAETAWKKIDVKNNGFVDRALANDMPLDVWRSVESDNLP
jgi:hypothetical protein